MIPQPRSALMLLLVAGMAETTAEGCPTDQQLFGLVPANSPIHILHLVTGALVLYLGLLHPSPSPRTN